MDTKNKLIIGILSVIAMLSLTSLKIGYQRTAKPQKEISARLSGAAFITSDLEASIEFYTKYLAFKEYKRMTINTSEGLAIFGVHEAKECPYASLVPNEWTKEKPNFPGLNFIEIVSAEVNPKSQDPKRIPVLGEIVKAYSVKNIEEITKLMKADDVPIIVPLARSATGKSETITVLDPNGVRVQLYEFVKEK